MSDRQVEILELAPEELFAILERSKTGPLSDEDRELLKLTIETLLVLESELSKEKASLSRLRKALSIHTKKTEKTSEVLGDRDEDPPPQGKNQEKKTKPKPKGHGRNGASAYPGAERIPVPHETLSSGMICPACQKGKIYKSKPRRLIRFKGQAPLSAKCWEMERLRCNLCGEVFTASPPEEVGEKKYDESSASMIALLKYGNGMPFNRLAKLGEALGLPLAASTQWEIVADLAMSCVPVYEELIRSGAQGELFHHDDTTMKILELLEENQRIEKEDSKKRTGMFTTAIVVIWEEHRIALFFTGRQHAGENLKDVLDNRASELEVPIQMCDGSSRNESKDLDTLLANCLVHGRRKFVEVADSFPDECRHVLETLCRVYKNDKETRKQDMSPERRLLYHQEHSAEIMAGLKRWMNEQLAEKKVEPNSSLGNAFSYMLKRWDKLTLFLRVPGAPLDNNICEQMLKKAILHRKNALFYKTLNGARVGDVFMTLIFTAELCGANPFDYLVTLGKYALWVGSAPAQWMPWNYQAALAALGETAEHCSATGSELARQSATSTSVFGDLEHSIGPRSEALAAA